MGFRSASRREAGFRFPEPPTGSPQPGDARPVVSAVQTDTGGTVRVGQCPVGVSTILQLTGTLLVDVAYIIFDGVRLRPTARTATTLTVAGFNSNSVKVYTPPAAVQVGVENANGLRSKTIAMAMVAPA